MNKYSVYIETLGCSKNQVDSEIMSGLMDDVGYELVEVPERADIVIVNTCGFIHDAKEESVKFLLDMGELKEMGQLKYLLATGCLAQRYFDELGAEMPEIDAFVGTGAFDEIVEVIETLDNGNEEKFFIGDMHKIFSEDLPRVLFQPGHSAFLKIAEGCDNLCTYCIIPKLRGRYRSRTIEAIVEEATWMAESGVKELIIIAQDTTRYGIDLYETPKLVALLEVLNAIDGIEWIRVQYSYPDIFDVDMIKAFGRLEKVCAYFDIPVQHASNGILKLMNRHTKKEDIESIIQTIRKEVPDASIRSTLIVGFPGETEEDFNVLYDFVKNAEFDKLGVFTFSDEEGTPSFKLPNKVDEDVKIQRRDAIMALQMGISERKQYAQIGKTMRVIIEEVAEEGKIYVGRTEHNAPEIDGVVYVHTKEALEIGGFYHVIINDALEYDLIGEMMNELSE